MEKRRVRSGHQCPLVTVCVCGYLKHLQQSFLLDLQPLERLLLLDYFLAQVLQTREVIAGHAPAQNARMVRVKDITPPKQQAMPDKLCRAQTCS